MPEEKTSYPAVDARKRKQKELFIEHLAKIANIEVVCQKIGVSRATFYRWRDDDSVFAEGAQDAINKGTDVINDAVEYKLVVMAQSGDFRAIKYYLGNCHPKYSARAEMARMEREEEDDDELTDAEAAIMAEALQEMPGFNYRPVPQGEATIASEDTGKKS